MPHCTAHPTHWSLRRELFQLPVAAARSLERALGVFTAIGGLAWRKRVRRAVESVAAVPGVETGCAQLSGA
ncbi:hypothetical protein ABZ470_20140 [Streptosporangium sp. NPDC020072]|uniref:hypothetical protein n=1 Tax=Streptosporangium sp. NPDC020072 TaxID=3154788 RepID=UPI00342DF754